MDNTLLKYGAKDHFFKAALCHFCVDMLNAKVISVVYVVVYSSILEQVASIVAVFCTVLLMIYIFSSWLCNDMRKCFLPSQTPGSANS